MDNPITPTRVFQTVKISSNIQNDVKNQIERFLSAAIDLYWSNPIFTKIVSTHFVVKKIHFRKNQFTTLYVYKVTRSVCFVNRLN